MPTSVLEMRARLEDAAARNLCSAFAATVSRLGGEVALRAREGPGRWRDWSWDYYADVACRVAGALDGLGLQRGERVALMLRNRPEFHGADMGTMLAGGTTLSIYNSSPPSRVAALLGHSNAVIAIVEDVFLDRIQAVRDQLPALRHVVVVGDTGPADNVVPWNTLLDAAAIDLHAAADAVAPEDVATIIYTSGTTGAPKGVLHTHRATTICVAMLAELWGSLEGFRCISYGPMAHIAERSVSHYVNATMGTVVHSCPVLSELPAVMAEIHPDWWFCAPRMWEKLQAGIEALTAQDPARAKAFQSARTLGAEVRALRAAGRPVRHTLAEDWDRARRDVIQPMLAPFGLDQVRIAATGAAPTRRDTHEFFLDCGVPVCENYGQSECPVITSAPADNSVPGTAGKPFPGVEVRLADDGEILARGPHVFAGYLDDPEATAETLDPDGWIHTGDLGVLDEQGNLKVIDRKNEIIVCSSGHNMSPVQMEAKLKEASLVSQACVVGQGRPFVVALLVLDPEGARTFAGREGLHGLTLADLARHPAVLAAVERDVAIANDRFPRAEQVRAFRLLAEEWPIDSELLTATAKLKRRGLLAHFQAVIEELYAGTDSLSPSLIYRGSERS